MKKFNLSAQSFAAANVDKENFQINGVIIAEQIETKDRRKLSVDDEFMEDFVKKTPPDGFAVEVDHNFWGGVGKKLGRIKNVRFDAANKLLLGDLHINPAADKSPTFEGGATYLLEMLQNDAKAYMMSMKVDYKYLYAMVDGVKKKIKEAYSWSEGYTRKIGGELFEGVAFMKLNTVAGVDVVNNGALTNSMFASGQDEALIEHLNDLSLSEGFREFITANFSKLEVFNAFFKHKYQKTNLAKIKELIGFSESENDPAQRIDNLETELNSFKTTAESLTTENDKLKQSNTEHLATIQTLNDQIIALKKEPTGEHPADTFGIEGQNDKKAYHTGPIMDKAMAIFSNSQNN